MDQPIPKKLHFVWMGTKPIEPKGTAFVDGDGKFRSSTVLANARINPECPAIMWLDLFTMVPLSIIQSALNPALWNKYSRWAKLAASEANGGIRPTMSSDLANARDPKNFKTVVEMLFQVRIQFNAYVGDSKRRQQLIENPNCPYGSMLALCQDKDHAVNETENPIKVHLLDTEVYPRWMKDSSKPEYKLVSWIFFELYMRGSNFGAASDMLRTQLLIDQGGLYVDHDDELVCMHDPATVPNPPGSPYRGFKHLIDASKDKIPFDVVLNKAKNTSDKNPLNNVPLSEEQKVEFDRILHPDKAVDADGMVRDELMRYYYIHVATTGYLAGPPAHPFLVFFRDRMLVDYDRLLENNYTWRKPNGDLVRKFGVESWFDFRRGKSPQTGNWLEFADFGIEVTGPGQLDRSLSFVADPNNNTKFPPSFVLDSIETRATNKYSNSWVGAGAGNTVGGAVNG